MNTFILNKKTKVYHDAQCKYAAMIEAENKETGYIGKKRRSKLKPCKHCITLKYIFERNKKDYVLLMDSLHLSYKLTQDWLLVQTEIAFWKIGFNAKKNRFILYHGNKSPLTSEVLEHVDSDYHRQKDVKFSCSISRYLNYIYKHDEFRKKGRGNIKVLVHGKRHKLIIQQILKNKRQRMAIARTYELIELLEKERREKASGE